MKNRNQTNLKFARSVIKYPYTNIVELSTAKRHETMTERVTVWSMSMGPTDRMREREREWGRGRKKISQHRQFLL